MADNYANFFVSVLAVALDATTDPADVEIASGDGANAPVAYPFRFTVDREVFICDGPVTGDTLENCQRAQEGSLIAAHNPGAYVRHGLTAAQAARFEAGGGGGGGGGSSEIGVHDGVTDDAPAINAAIAAAGAGDRVQLSAGTYAVKSSINADSNVELVGMGKEITIIKAISTFTGTSVIECPGGGVQYFALRDLSVDANSLAATAVKVGAGALGAGHNMIDNVQARRATSVGIDAGAAIGGSETHVKFCDITACPTAIRSGQDNSILTNNMGSFSTYGIELRGGGNYVAGNHPVSNSSGSSICMRVLTGLNNQIVNNYFDSGTASLAAPMLLVNPGAGNTIRGLVITGNVFLAPTVATTLTYPVITLDMTTGTISTVTIGHNTGVGDSAHLWSSILHGINTPTDVFFHPGAFYFVDEPYTGFTPTAMSQGIFYDGVSTKTSSDRRRYQDITISGAGTTTLNAREDGRYRINVTAASTNFTLTTSNAASGLEMEVLMKNASGGTLGTVTWTGFVLGDAWTNPANGKYRSIRFFYDGSNWVETYRSAVDV